MNTPYYIAKRLYFSSEQNGNRVSRPAVRVAVAGVAIGIVVMLLTLCIVMGFKQEILQKVSGFGSHIQIVNFDNNNTYQMKPILATDSLLQVIGHIDNVKSVSRFSTKPGILKTDSAFQGIVIKGRENDAFFEQNLCEGTMPTEPTDILVSKNLSRQLGLHVDDAVYTYFVDEKVRVRKYHITGLYDTRFSDYDQLFIIGNLSEVKRLNGFEEDEVSGIEIMVDNFAKMEEVAESVYFLTANRPDPDGNMLYTQTIQDVNPAIFSWLQLLDMNVLIIIILMLAVSGFCIISGLIILILDSIQLIGTLKALGADNRLLRKTFLYEAGFLIGKGLLWGNIIGLTLVAIQYFGHVIPLDPANYYVSYVPVVLNWGVWLMLNLGTLLLSLHILLGPSAIVAQISPAKVMHFE